MAARRTSLAVGGRLLLAVLAATGAACERARKQNVPDGEARVLRVAPEATATGTEGAAAETEPVSADEARLRATARRLGLAYDKAKTPEDRADVLEKIGQLKTGGVELLPVLDRAAEDPASVVRAFAARARADVQPETSAQKFEKALKDPEEEVRMAVADVLPRLPSPQRWAMAVDALRREKSPRVQEALLSAIEKGEPDAAAVSALVGLLRSQATGDAPQLTMAAVKPLARALAKSPVAARDGADLLAGYLSKHDPDVRAIVAKTLGILDHRSKAVRAALVAALTDPEAAVRTPAFDVLKAWSGNDFGYVPAADEALRRDAVRAFAKWSADQP